MTPLARRVVNARVLDPVAPDTVPERGPTTCAEVWTDLGTVAGSSGSLFSSTTGWSSTTLLIETDRLLVFAGVVVDGSSFVGDALESREGVFSCVTLGWACAGDCERVVSLVAVSDSASIEPVTFGSGVSVLSTLADWLLAGEFVSRAVDVAVLV